MAESVNERMPDGDAAGVAEPRQRAKDPRAQTQAQMREVRARLAQGSTIKPEFEYELLSMFARNELSARVTLPLLALIFSLASMFWAPVLQASAWLAIVISIKSFSGDCRMFVF